MLPTVLCLHHDIGDTVLCRVSNLYSYNCPLLCPPPPPQTRPFPQGTLAQLDSANPVFYLNFPSGRLKFSGTLLFPANKYMVLRLGGGPGGAALAEDVFENIVSVSRRCWEGS
jgi:hypothetical protein